MREGIVLRQKGDLGTRFIEAVQDVFRAGPKKLAPDEAQALRMWAPKMLARIAEGDTEANYRRAWLLTQLLEDYFSLRGEWYLGPKESLTRLEADRPEDWAAFDRALAPAAPLEAIKALVELVIKE
ncbi:hypothetical protein [Polyangium sp. 15x6]|uniref:hypothetical protein n=1 Tax=Polyangium sp. 15x6 TaxID=3042687 RepID=UPI00249C6A21|nr:hypothetical protein [Polyangium sp. 15x6]MDI3284118.1 hypothetical protein [Polyangium sp. 15x6]